MVKRISLVRRRKDLTPQQFAAHWLGPHADIARGIPGLRGYRINLARDPDDAGWDGVAETWFDSEEAAREGFASEPLKSPLTEDRPKFIDYQVVFFVDVHIVAQSPD